MERAPVCPDVSGRGYDFFIAAVSISHLRSFLLADVHVLGFGAFQGVSEPFKEFLTDRKDLNKVGRPKSASPGC